MTTKIINLKISATKLQTLMAKKLLSPYKLCDIANISYQTYRRIITIGNCKLSTLGKIANALEADINEIIEQEE